MSYVRAMLCDLYSIRNLNEPEAEGEKFHAEIKNSVCVCVCSCNEIWRKSQTKKGTHIVREREIL